MRPAYLAYLVRPRFRFAPILCFILFSLPFCAPGRTKVQPSDTNYYIHNNPSFSFIFSESFLEGDKKNLIHKKLHYYNDVYKEFFNSKLKQKPVYIFASSQNQISNASTSAVPFLRALFYPTGVDMMQNMSNISWADTVIAHEMAHVFQLGQTSPHLKYLNKIFGNSEVIFIPLPVFFNVNMVMPLFLLEGHATLNESLFAPGGRLYSGFVRALVFSQIKHKFKNTNHFIKNYLVNITEDTFSTQQPYFHGAYFFNSLLKKYKLKTINSMFKNHAEYFMFPLAFVSVKSAFESTFDRSFESLTNHYIQTYLPLAGQQNQSKEPALFHSRTCPPFNKKGDEIFFLSPDLKSTPVLSVFNLKTGKWKRQRKVFKSGKVFKIGNEYYVSSSDKINTTQRAYGLFSEGMYMINKYKSQSVQDIRGNDVLSIDTSDNMSGFRLLLNGKFYDYTHSPALFGPDGKVYYFKQDGDRRVMYKNKEPVFQFKGFYGKPVEIDEQGIVYFISATLYGSSLFAWIPGGGIYRLSSSDVVVNAVRGNKDRFLVCELEPDSYSYKMIPLQERPEAPAFYDYSFPQTKLVSSRPEETASYKSSNDISYSTYYSLWRLRFNGLELGGFYDAITGYNGTFGITFSDPMAYNSIQFTYQASYENWAIRSKYTNQAYRLSWDIQHIYSEGPENFSGSRTYAYIHELSQGFSFPFFKTGYWKSRLYWKNALSSLELKPRQNQLQNHTTYHLSMEPSLQLQYGRKYSQNFDFHRKFFTEVSLQYRLGLSNELYSWRLKTKSHYTVNWGWEFYTTPFFTYQRALKPKSLPFRYFLPLSADRRMEFLNSLSFPVGRRIFEETNDYLSAGLKLQKFIEVPLYFARFPLSLISLTPTLGGRYLRFLDNDKQEYPHFVEWTFGIKTGILIHHKVKAKIHVYSGWSHSLNSFLSFFTQETKQRSPAKEGGLNKQPENNFYLGFQFQAGI